MFINYKKNRNFDGPWNKTPGRLLGIILIRFYQLAFSGFTGNQCRHLPTCSEYAYEAIARHGLWAGIWLGFFRTIRCGPCGTYGFDPVPKEIGRCYWYTPWRYYLLIKQKTGNIHNINYPDTREQ